MSRILIIDDDGIARDALEVFLTRAGHEVVTAADGDGGLKAFREGPPDLVILDLVLPGLSGAELLSEMRKAVPALPIIVLTGYAEPGAAEQYRGAGAASFLSKGDGLSQVLAEADKLLGAPAKAPPADRYQRKRASPGAVPADAPKILVADDELSVLNLLSRFLAAEGYAVACVRDGAGVVKAVEAEHPRIILLDIQLPGRSGVELLEELREKSPLTGVIMITGNEDEDVARRCLENGAFDYLSKPLNLCALETIIKACLLEQKRGK